MQEYQAVNLAIAGCVTYYPHLMGEKISKGRKIGSALGYGAMNIVFGLGSYLQGDVAGGLIVTGGYAASVGLIIWEVAGMTYDDALAGIPSLEHGTGHGQAAVINRSYSFFRKVFIRGLCPMEAAGVQRLLHVFRELCDVIWRYAGNR